MRCARIKSPLPLFVRNEDDTALVELSPAREYTISSFVGPTRTGTHYVRLVIEKGRTVLVNIDEVDITPNHTN